MKTSKLYAIFYCFIQGAVCQVIRFPSGIQIDHSNDLDRLTVNWTSDGQLLLTQKDLILFEPKVVVHEMSELCSIDLRTCSSNEQSAVTSDMCFCTKESEKEYNLHIRGQGRLYSDDVIVQATVPSRFLFSPLAAVSQVGTIQGVGDKETSKSLETQKRIQELEKTLSAKISAANDLEKALAEKVNARNNLEKALAREERANKELVTALAEERDAAKKTRKDLDVCQNQSVSLLAELGSARSALETPRTCADVQDSNPRPVVTLQNGLEVVCDTVTDNGGWIIIQRRASQDVDFYRNWTDYKYGFGNIHGNMWFGLEKVHRLTFKRRYELRVDITFNRTNYFAHYDNFTLLGEPEKYKILISGYSGNAGDSLTGLNNMAFTTKDMDNDILLDSRNCAVLFHGAWWYQACHGSNLNGEWGSKEYARGLTWVTTTGSHDGCTFTELKIRPLSQR